MKNHIMFIALFLTQQIYGQVHQNGIGLRYATGTVFRNSEFTYQLGINQHNRLQFGLGYQYVKANTNNISQLRTSLYYQHVWNIKGGLNWYLGAGLKYDFARIRFSNMLLWQHNLSIGPTIGFEYDFSHKNIPLVLGLDYRPSFVLSPTLGGKVQFQNQFGLSLHYTFKGKK